MKSLLFFYYFFIFLLNFFFLDNKLEKINLETNYANLKNLQEELSNALKMHEMTKEKKLRNKFF